MKLIKIPNISVISPHGTLITTILMTGRNGSKAPPMVLIKFYDRWITPIEQRTKGWTVCFPDVVRLAFWDSYA